MKTAHLFAGIGGPALAAQWMGWEPIWFAEVDPYASQLLTKNFPGRPNHGDVRSIDGSLVERPDLLTGGFPCQDISLAGKGAGIAPGTRSGLWSEFARLIGELRPRYALIENVSALRSRGLDRVLADLAALGYDAEWHCVPASHVGAPHRRDRIWIVAYPHTDDPRLEGRIRESLRERPDEQPAGTLGALFSRAARLFRSTWWDVEPSVGRVAHGVPKRVDRLKCLGNSVVPQEVLLFLKAIEAREEALRESVA